MIVFQVIAVISLILALYYGRQWRQSQRLMHQHRQQAALALNALSSRDYAGALAIFNQAQERGKPLAYPLESTRDNLAGLTAEQDDSPPQLETTFRNTIQLLETHDREEQAARRELEDVLASLQDAVLVVDDEARLRFLNAAASDLFGVQVEDVLGAQILEALPSFGLESAVREALVDGQSHAHEVSLYTSSYGTATRAPFGTESGRREVLLRVAPVRRSDGVVSGAVAIVQDLTELRRLERVRRDFVANASHELRTPIANIRAAAETILDSSEDETLVKRFLPQLVSEAERLSRLVTDLLDLARADSAMDAPRTSVELSKIIREAARRLKDSAESNHIAIYCDCEEQVFVMGDAAALEQVAVNLLENAIMYTPPRGSIILSVHVVEQVAPQAETNGAPRHEVDTIDDDAQRATLNLAAGSLATAMPMRQVVFSVRDTGIGIPAADVPRIFERFYRVDKARSRAQGGTGLGLAIVKHIVEKHGGHVKVESESGKGSTFIVTLPAA
jgi:two-component system phosphate regulon sensor histidine kinase PhoR